MPRASTARCKKVARCGIELAFHQRRHQMHDRYIHAMRFEPAAASRPSRPPPMTTALARDCAASSMAFTSSRSRKVKTPARSIARYRQDDRRRSRRDDQFVVMRDRAVVGDYRLRDPVDGDDLVALIERDVVLDVPTIAVDDDLLVILLAGQNRREHDAVVIDARLGIEDGDLIATRRLLEKMFQHATGRHAVADDNKPLNWTRRRQRGFFVLEHLRSLFRFRKRNRRPRSWRRKAAHRPSARLRRSRA